mmetsp:Transcript_26366/g.46854  ORF Transcript_26366/g.46854 Transcript_26366/m.46854 type:complete len:325 (+) Transcript_26366:294-1268(+)
MPLDQCRKVSHSCSIKGSFSTSFRVVRVLVVAVRQVQTKTIRGRGLCPVSQFHVQKGTRNLTFGHFGWLNGIIILTQTQLSITGTNHGSSCAVLSRTSIIGSSSSFSIVYACFGRRIGLVVHNLFDITVALLSSRTFLAIAVKQTLQKGILVQTGMSGPQIVQVGLSGHPMLVLLRSIEIACRYVRRQGPQVSWLPSGTHRVRLDVALRKDHSNRIHAWTARGPGVEFQQGIPSGCGGAGGLVVVALENAGTGIQVTTSEGRGNGRKNDLTVRLGQQQGHVLSIPCVSSVLAVIVVLFYVAIRKDAMDKGMRRREGRVVCKDYC